MLGRRADLQGVVRNMNPRTILLALACSPSAASAQLMSGKGGLLASHYDTLMKGTAGVNTCVVGDTEPCDLADMPKDETTMVYPGGETRCIFSTSSDFAFQVFRGVGVWVDWVCAVG